MSSGSFCPHCGGNIEAVGAEFCPHCGASLEGVAPAGVPARPTEHKEVLPKAKYVPPGVELATTGSRFFALLIDWIIFGALFMLIIVIPFGLEEEFESNFRRLFLLPIFALFYWLLLEGVNDGQTLGKMAVSIRVVKFDKINGTISRCTMGASVARNLLRIVDWLPFAYIIGLISIGNSDQNQRIGDRVADTIVIKV